jgi:hypothetical protein
MTGKVSPKTGDQIAMKLGCENMGPHGRSAVRIAISSLIIQISLGILSATVPGQDEDIFETRTLEIRVQNRYRLSPAETKVLHPLIVNENYRLVLAYVRFSEDQGDDFLSLWNEVRVSRSNFESNISSQLTRRQKQALQAARSNIETRILGLWRDDYLAILTDELELDPIQQNCVKEIFRKETEKRHRILIIEAQTGIRKDAEWRALSESRDSSLREILDPDQNSNYLEFTQNERNLMA